MKNKTLPSLTQRLNAGAISGLFGGLFFGLLLGILGILPEIASLVGSTFSIVGFIIHMFISIFFGALFGFVMAGQFHKFWHGIVLGAAYGIFWWVLGALIIMPALQGLGIQVNNALTPLYLLSLIGHLIYGVATGISLAIFSRAQTKESQILKPAYLSVN